MESTTSKNENRFPEEYKRIYEEANEDLIPISSIFGRGKKTRHLTSNSINKIIPLEDTEEDNKKQPLAKLNNL